ncbi:MAG: DUF4270 domain-containing protein [Bacteroidales bacterium]|jgi:hypothetical protein|nr:DUF4270 domain-containing protein [Bacteroidales bacterium]
MTIRLFPLTFIFSLLILSSCKKDVNSILGDDINEHRKIGEYYADSFHIVAFSVPDDSLYIQNYTSFVLGTSRNSTFGTTTYDFVSRMVYSVTSSYVKTDNEPAVNIDSTVLLLVYSGTYPLAANSDFLDGKSFTLTLYEVDEDIRTSTEIDSAYDIHSRVAYKSTPLFSGNVTLKPPLSTDTVATTNISLHLDSEVGRKLAQALEEVGIENNEEFPTKFKGLYFSITPAASDNESVIVSFSAEATYGTQMTVYFDSSYYYSFIIGTHFTQIKKDRSGTPVERALLDSVTGQQRLYLETIGGSRIRFKIPDLRKLLDNDTLSGKHIAINRASLIFRMADDIDTSVKGVRRPESLFLYKYINKTKIESIIDYGFNGGGVYDATKGEYRLYVTRWMQDLIYNKKTEIDYLDLSPVADIKYFVPSQAVFYGTNSGANSVKLEVIYSIVEE